MLKAIVSFLQKVLSGDKNFTGISLDNKLIEQNASTVNNVAVQNNIVQGPTYRDVQEIALDVFKQNFPRLKSYAEQVANERILKFLNEFIPLISENLYYRFTEPDIQYTWNNIAQITALRNDDELNNILGQLLIEKLQSKNDYDSLIISKVIKLLQNTSIEELKILALYHLVKNKIISSTSPEILSYLLNFDITRCNEYALNLISNGIAYRSGGFASEIHSDETGNNEEYVKQINELFHQFPIFVNFVVLECGKKITEKYLSSLSNMDILQKQ
ncbi:MAG: LPO_1073/Vpar_1526 family protein [Candidatus Gastranaerophilaceae bacterium]